MVFLPLIYKQKMKIRYLFFITLLFASFGQIYAQQEDYSGQVIIARSFRSFGGRRMPDEEKECRLLAVRFFDDEEYIDYVVFDFAFSKEINPLSVKKENILINGKIYNGKIIFKRNSRAFRYVLRKTEFENLNQKFNVSLSGIKTYDDESLPKIDIEGMEVNANYLYSVREGQWKKF